MNYVPLYLLLPCLSLCVDFPLWLSPAPLGKMPEKSLSQRFGRVLPKTSIHSQENEPECCQTALLQGSLSSAQWSHLCQTFTHICTHTYAVGLLSVCTDPKQHILDVRLSYFCLFVSLFLPSRRSSWRASRVASSMLMTEVFSCRGGFVHTHTHTHNNNHNTDTEWAACSCVPADGTKPSLFNYW